MFNALTSSDTVERLFPEGHELYPLVRPTFDSLRRSMSNHIVSAIWMDSSYFPDRAGYRESYDVRYGEGSVNVMPFIATWLSTGPGSEKDGNTILFPAGIDRTIIDHAASIGLLGGHEFVSSLDDIRRVIREKSAKIYSIDDLGDEFRAHSVISADLNELLNSKDSLAKVSRFAPREIIKDMFEMNIKDFRLLKKEGERIYLKTCNTESAGAGVFMCLDEDDFEKHLADIREKQKRFNLSRKLVLQPEIKGKNRSFQIFLDNERPDELQVLTITDQLVEDDGITYRGSLNYPATAEALADIGPVMLDMVARVRALHADAFGILMCDFFETPDGRIVIYDPGIRPTGNTATAMATLLARKLTGKDLFVSNFHLRTNTRGLTFADFVAKAGKLSHPDNIAAESLGLLPWGWNDKLGFGVLIGVAPNEEKFDELKKETMDLFGMGEED